MFFYVYSTNNYTKNLQINQFLTHRKSGRINKNNIYKSKGDRKMIVFMIENKQQDYSKCFSIISFIKEGKPFEFWDVPLNVVLIDELTITYAGIIDFSKLFLICNEKAPYKISNNSNFSEAISCSHFKVDSFCFFVSNSDESDVLNFHYFDLIRRNYESNCFLLIDPKDENDYFRISDFYQLENVIDSESYSHRFCKTKIDGKCRIVRLAKNNLHTSKSLLPLLRTGNREYSILSKNILEEISFDRLFGDNLFDSLITNVQTRTVENVIIDFCRNLTSGITHTCHIDWQVYKEQLSQLSVLGYCYFVSYLYVAVKDEEFTINPCNLNNLILQAEDFANGTIQLFENALKHSQYGYFCYRMHCTTDKKNYLFENYEITPKKNEKSYYLEILISDYNTEFDIPQKFIQNLKADNNYRVTKEIINQYEKVLKLKDFFNPSEECVPFWEEYYSKKSNIALHYGLNIFEQIVISSGGRFVLFSSNDIVLSSEKCYGTSEKNKENERSFHVPGTQYRIILPVKSNITNQSSTGLKINLDSSKLKFTWVQHTIRFVEKGVIPPAKENIAYIEYSDFKYSHPVYKESSVIRLGELLYQKTQGLGNHDIVVFDVEELKTSLYNETFSKAFICLLSKSNLKHVAIINASHAFISTFIRIFGLLFYKKITRDFLSKNEIYICGNLSLQSDTYTEIVFKGNNISTSFELSKRMADYKGEYPAELSILENIVSKCEKQRRQRNINVFPFDILVQDKNKTLFQNKTIIDLSQNIQKYSFGCKLPDVHMKVGSKIHITDCFYEATLLFGIENYISRFSVLLAQSIYQKIKQKECKDKIVLIGYETYSELLMVETQYMLKKLHNITSEYFIYEDPLKQQKFRGIGEIKSIDPQNTKFVIIVPIGSTLTTHDKILADLKRELKLRDNKCILTHLCVVLIRDKDKKLVCTKNELEYWSSIDENKVTLSNEHYNIGANNEIGYSVSVSNTWENPNKCKYCFPSELTEEKPILKVNKSSVVPMIMVGINEESAFIGSNNPSKTIVQNADIRGLKGCLRYGHFFRGDNHFEYYFMTEKLSKKIVSNDHFTQWMESVKKAIESKTTNKDIARFDFVVSPQHTTNAEFILMINEHVFGNPASVIMIDVKKEYRDNIKTKFSYLTQLYSNLHSYGRRAIINFHFVDDTITTGASFYKCKSFIQSLFPQVAFSSDNHNNVIVNVFSSVILLLGRCSLDTKRGYVQDGRFFNYFDLNISALRNYEDACVICKKHSNYKEMRKLSATNSLEGEFSLLMKQHELKSYNESSDVNDENGYYRMIITHELNLELKKIYWKKNDDSIVLTILLKYMTDMISKEKRDAFLYSEVSKVNTFLNVISSPFMIFRKSVLSATFKLLLNIACYLIFNDYRTKEGILGDELKKYINNLESDAHQNNLKSFVECVFWGLASLGSNLLIRVKTINAFFTYTKRHFAFDSESHNKWIIYYCMAVKKSLMINKQDSRVLWLEKVLSAKSEENNTETLCQHINPLNLLLIMENNLILCDTLNEGVGTIQNYIVQNKEDLFESIKNENEKYSYSHEEITEFSGISESTKTDLVVRILFDMVGKVRYGSELKKELKETIQAYFCEAFREFSRVNANNEESDTVNQLLDMSILYLLLMPNSSLFGERKEHLKFYKLLINQIKEVLRVNRVQLFMCREDTFDFIGSSESKDNESDPEYESFIQSTNTHDKELTVIGETYYYSRAKCIAAIKIVNNTINNSDLNELSNKKKTSWYLVFNVKSTSNIESLLINARNLLVMREALLMRLCKDYDNNLYEEFSELRKKVRKLTDDKAGGHTPFAELSQDFDYLYGQSFLQNSIHNTEIANQMKLVTDLLISKLYVCHINEDHYPEQIEDRFDELQYCRLSDYKDIMAHSCNLVLRRENSVEIRPKISFEKVDWNKSFSFMKKSVFIWISMFYSLIMNSLRHGKTESETGSINNHYVDIKISTDDNYLVVSNSYFPDAEIDKKNGITLETIKAFFNHFGFSFREDRKGEDFLAKIPLERKTDNEKNSIN